MVHHIVTITAVVDTLCENQDNAEFEIFGDT